LSIIDQNQKLQFLNSKDIHEKRKSLNEKEKEVPSIHLNNINFIVAINKVHGVPLLF